MRPSLKQDLWMWAAAAGLLLVTLAGAALFVAAALFPALYHLA